MAVIVRFYQELTDVTTRAVIPGVIVPTGQTLEACVQIAGGVSVIFSGATVSGGVPVYGHYDFASFGSSYQTIYAATEDVIGTVTVVNYGVAVSTRYSLQISGSMTDYQHWDSVAPDSSEYLALGESCAERFATRVFTNVVVPAESELRIDSGDAYAQDLYVTVMGIRSDGASSTPFVCGSRSGWTQWFAQVVTDAGESVLCTVTLTDLTDGDMLTFGIGIGPLNLGTERTGTMS